MCIYCSPETAYVLAHTIKDAGRFADHEQEQSGDSGDQLGQVCLRRLSGPFDCALYQTLVIQTDTEQLAALADHDDQRAAVQISQQRRRREKTGDHAQLEPGSHDQDHAGKQGQPGAHDYRMYRITASQGQDGRADPQRDGTIVTDVHLRRGCAQNVSECRSDRTV